MLSAKARASRAKASTARAKAKAKQGQQGQQAPGRQRRDKSTDMDKSKDSIECWKSGEHGHNSKDCWSKKDTNSGGSKGKHKAKNATDAHDLGLTKPANVGPRVEIGGLDMCYLDAHAVEVRETEWIKIGVDAGAGKTACLQNVTWREDDS